MTHSSDDSTQRSDAMPLHPAPDAQPTIAHAVTGQQNRRHLLKGLLSAGVPMILTLSSGAALASASTQCDTATASCLDSFNGL
ncbi:MAG: hypothetical protein HQL91_11405 [Magnetococcales bacterium]|nr:hypothetical protein [Magnetococcales bacterium]